MFRKPVKRLPFKILALFARMMFWVFRVTLHHKNIAEEVLLDGKTPVCYVLKYHSIIDWLTLVYLCRKHRLPRPYYSPSAAQKITQGSYYYLNKRGWVWTTNRKAGPPEVLRKLLDLGRKHPQIDLVFVPVNIFWGRNPGKEDSPFKLFFFDEDYAGLLQRFFTIFFQARRINVRFGKVVHMRELLDTDPNLDSEEAAKKLRRLIRVHFHQVRVGMLGPQLYSQELAIRWILRSPTIQQLMAETAEKSNLSMAKVQSQVERTVREISANTSYAVIRFFEIVLSQIWKRLYQSVEIKNGEYLRRCAEDAEIVYLPCHRSHFDYLLIGFYIHQFGLMVPHIGGGDNLNFFPVGQLLRRAGAFFLRRKFGGNRLYTAVFNEYIHYIINKHHPLGFFIEGGRSRSGKLLQPKTGMLAMVLHSFIRSPRPIKFVPVSITYDQVVEQASYRKELAGAKKKKENLLQLIIAAFTIFRHNYGKAHLKFASAIDLEQIFNDEKPDWQQHIYSDMQKPPWLSSIVNKVALVGLEKVNQTTVVSPVALLSTFLLVPNKCILAEEDVIRLFELSIALNKQCPFSPDVEFPPMTPGEILSYALNISKLSTAIIGAKTFIIAQDAEAPLLNYYRNNIAHLFALPSLICSFFTHTDELSLLDLQKNCRIIYPLLKQEYFLPFKLDTLDQNVAEVVTCLTQLGLLHQHDQILSRPNASSREFYYMSIFGKMLAESLERIALMTMTIEILSKKDESCSSDTIITESQRTIDQYASINGTTLYSPANDPSYQLIVSYFQVNLVINFDANGRLQTNQAFENFKMTAKGLLRKDFVENVSRTLIN